MPRIIVKKAFSFSDNGYQLVPYEPGDPVEVSDECAAVAVAERWAELPKAASAAPENKDAARQRKTKASQD